MIRRGLVEERSSRSRGFCIGRSSMARVGQMLLRQGRNEGGDLPFRYLRENNHLGSLFPILFTTQSASSEEEDHHLLMSLEVPIINKLSCSTEECLYSAT